MNDFTASNGLRVGVSDNNDPDYPYRAGGCPVAQPEFDALREFFRAEEDERLGRWRWPETPDFVVYAWTADPSRKARGVTVLSETIPRGYTVWEDNVDVLYGTSENEEARVQARKAARAYFDAHPEPKPAWHNAKPGEVWVLTMDGREFPWGVGSGIYSGKFVYLGGTSNIPLDWHEITAGRRIFPEGSE